MNEFHENDADPDRSACQNAIEALQRLLDRESDWDSPLAEAHRSTCSICREELLLAGSLSGPMPAITVPLGLSDRVLNQAIGAHRRRRLTRYAAFASLAACMLIAIFAMVRPSPPETGAATVPVVIAPVPKADPVVAKSTAKPIGESMTEARDAIVSLTRRTASETKDQSEKLLPAPKVPLDPNPADGLEPLADARSGASRSVKPLRQSAQRAFNFFLRAADPPDRQQ